MQLLSSLRSQTDILDSEPASKHCTSEQQRAPLVEVPACPFFGETSAQRALHTTLDAILVGRMYQDLSKQTKLHRLS